MISLLAALSLLPVAIDTPAREQLILFRSEPHTEAERRFEHEHLARLRDLAESLGLDWQVRNVASGAPAEVRLTPLLVHQNAQGRSIYQGRYTHRERIENFVRTARWFPQEAIPLERERVLLRHIGRTTIAIHPKITSVAGRALGDDDPARDEFERRAREAVDRGLRSFHSATRAQLSRSDRTFYFDFHPYRTEGELFVSGAIFSQFDCEEPIFTTFDSPAVSTGSDFATAFERAAAALGAALDDLLATSDRGDAFAPVPSDAPTRSWEELGLALPVPAEPSGDADSSRPRSPLATSWRLRPRTPDSGPRLQFRFPPPLDSYSGELRDVTGVLHFERADSGDAPEARSLEGRIVVRVASITMGDEHLDDSLLAPDTLDATRHPESSFEVERIETGPGPLRFGELRPATLHGTFRMKGVAIPLSTPLTLEPMATTSGEVRLHAVGRFELRLAESFGIQGPDGPSPANDTLQFRYDLEYEPIVPGDKPN